MKLHLSSLLFLGILLLACIIRAETEAGAAAPSFDASSNVDPEAMVDYVINFDENHVKKEDMDMVAEWLKERSIDVKENELASYAAYQVATLNRKLGMHISASSCVFNQVDS